MNDSKLEAERRRIAEEEAKFRATARQQLILGGVVQIVISNQSSDIPVSTPSTKSSASPTETATEPSASPSVRTEPLTLTIAATRGNSFIDIVVDGEHVSKGSMFQGEKKSFTGQTAISIYFSNPAGLDVTLNGKALAPLGGQNEEVRRTFR